MKITMLLENTSARNDIIPRHGMSLWIETKDKKILFDMGPDKTFKENAEKLSIDISQADLAIVSHGHNDHGGGLNTILNTDTCHPIPIYIRQSALDRHLSDRKGTMTDIGLDPTAKDSKNLHWTRDIEPVTNDLLLFSQTGPDPFRSRSNDTLYAQKDGTIRPDDFDHEQYLLITEDDKTILITGCSHAGIWPILQQAIQLAGKQPDLCIGGFHLCKPSTGECESEQQITALARQLKTTSTKFCTCHCTGTKPFHQMKQILTDQLEYFSAGQTIEI